MSESRTCDRCDTEFFRRTEGRWPERNHEWRTRRFCSRRCAFHYASTVDGTAIGRFSSKKAGDDSAEMIGSHALLVRCIKYGLAHDRHLGMGATAFMARACELGLVSKNHGGPSDMGSIGSPVLTSGHTA